MKKLWLILLSVGLLMALSAPAFAVDVKVSGEFYVGGLYLNKVNVNDKDYNLTITNPNKTTYTRLITSDVSTAFFYQRLRIGTDFIVSPSLKLVTRFDALERIWGGARSAPASGTLSPVSGSGYYSPLAMDSAGTTAENENIAFDLAYIDYVSPIGTFDVGYMMVNSTGTIFGNNSTPGARIKFISLPIGAFTISADITKAADNSYSAVNSSYFANVTNADNNYYGLEGYYTWKDGKAGMKVTYYDYASTEPQPLAPLPGTTTAASYNYATKYTLFTPYVMAKIGPVNVQAEANYAIGKYKAYDSGNTNTDVSISNLTAFLDATANFAPVYVGGTFAYVSGDDPNTTDKQEGGTLTGGWDWNPCLLMFSYYDINNWVGPVYGYNAIAPTALGKAGTSMVDGPMSNAWFFQGRVGVKPTSNLDVMLSVSYATADKKPTDNGKPTGKTFANGTYGTEVDLTGTYKITNNLSYMLGFGYLFTGDYFKGTNGTNKVDDDYLFINKLTLSF
jgi:hypothetical protein